MQASHDDSAIEKLYEQLKTYAGVVRRDRRLAGPKVDSVRVRSPICGSELTLDAVIENDRVQQLGWRVRACALGQASTAIVIGRARELDAPTVQTVGAQLQAILKGEVVACDWPELAFFSFAQDIPSRHESAMLPFRALAQLFERARD